MLVLFKIGKPHRLNLLKFQKLLFGKNSKIMLKLANDRIVKCLKFSRYPLTLGYD